MEDKTLWRKQKLQISGASNVSSLVARINSLETRNERLDQRLNAIEKRLISILGKTNVVITELRGKL